MRLFTAIQFDDTTKFHIGEIQARLRNLGQKGNFTHEENLHLTLVFIGETPTNKIDSIIRAVNEVNMPPFIIELSGLGYFKQNGGDLYWLGVKENKQLNALYKNMTTVLRGIEISVDDRPYKPHLTLARKFVAVDSKSIITSIGKINEQSVAVNKISLMKSERVGGKLIYTEIHANGL